MSKLSIHIVTWNSELFLGNALRSLFTQTYRDFTVLIVDNASTDNTARWLKEHYPQIRIVENSKNLGFARAHNQAIHFSRSEYVLTMNPDVILNENFLEKLLKGIGSCPEAGSASGLVYRLEGKPEALTQDSFTKIIDTTGIKAFKNRRFIDRDAGGVRLVQDNAIEEIFGTSCALALYRRSALEDIKVDQECFDEDFHSYKEDVDMAWRLRLRGWGSLFVPMAVAYHHRKAYGKEQQGNFTTLKNHRNKSTLINSLSSRNHLWMLVKNEQAKNFRKHFLFIFWYELKRWGIILLMEPQTLKGLFQFFQKLPLMKMKRRIIQSNAKASAEEIIKWFQ